MSPGEGKGWKTVLTLFAIGTFGVVFVLSYLIAWAIDTWVW